MNHFLLIFISSNNKDTRNISDKMIFINPANAY